MQHAFQDFCALLGIIHQTSYAQTQEDGDVECKNRHVHNVARPPTMIHMHIPDYY